MNRIILKSDRRGSALVMTLLIIATLTTLAVGFSEAIRNSIVQPLQLAGVEPAVSADEPLIETPMLIGGRGAAVTVLNWTGGAFDRVRLTARVPFEVKSVAAVKAGKLEFRRTAKGVETSLPLGAADIVMLRP